MNGTAYKNFKIPKGHLQESRMAAEKLICHDPNAEHDRKAEYKDIVLLEQPETPEGEAEILRFVQEGAAFLCFKGQQEYIDQVDKLLCHIN